MRYELWDTETSNIIGAYATEAEALAIVREAITVHGRGSISAWALGSMGDGRTEEPIVEGTALAGRALRFSALASGAENTLGTNDTGQSRHYVGTIVGESTSREFRLAVAHGTIREQDIVAVDADLQPPDAALPPEPIRVWAKVKGIERLNPLFPTEAGHELAATRTNPLDTVLSLRSLF